MRPRDEWLSIRDVCAMLHCCEESLRRLRLNHGFPRGRNLNGLSLLRWSRIEIEDWLARREPDDVAPRDTRFHRGTARSHGAGASAEGGGDDAGMPE